MYIILPILLISEISIILLSQLLEETCKTCVSCLLIKNNLDVLSLFILLGNISLMGIKKAKIAIIASGILLLVSPISSETLIFINISMNKNKMDTAPTYTNK